MGSNLGLISGFRLDTFSRGDHMEERITEASFALASHPAAVLHLFFYGRLFPSQARAL